MARQTALAPYANPSAVLDGWGTLKEPVRHDGERDRARALEESHAAGETHVAPIEVAESLRACRMPCALDAPM